VSDLLKLIRVQWDRAGAIVAVCAGALALLFGYLGVSGTAYVAAQMPYFISGGLLGIFLLGLGAVLWISADMRDEWRELRALRTLLAPDSLQAPVIAQELTDHGDDQNDELEELEPIVAANGKRRAPRSGRGPRTDRLVADQR
jgi:hypothetical protein